LKEYKGKYGVNAVLDLKVYGADGLLFEIDTMKSYVISRNFETGENVLIVEDALVDVKFMNDVFHGKYNNKNLRIKGKTKYRGCDAVDRKVKLDITIAKMDSYRFEYDSDSVGFVTIEFVFPTKDAYGFNNMNVKIKD